ncbi:MAG TPA: hypothetical protein VJ672_04900 [Gemmatimonadaceae bacterium]|nr:hypothetical protein [Gemmatimonadaceae bacterium]
MLAALVFAAGCEQQPRQPPAVDTTTTPPLPPPQDTVQPRPRTTTWDSTAGPALFVHAPPGIPGATLVVTPDADSDAPIDSSTFDVRRLRNLPVEMFTRAGQVGQGQLGRVSEHADTSSCALWPIATLTGAPSVPATWAIGFQRGRARAIPVDSIETLASQDSARLAADLTRLASALPNDTAAALRGIPFSVRSAYRLALNARDTAIVAHIIRKLTIEANPLEEHIFLIAERDTTFRSTWRVAYSERTSGSEENVETTDALAAVAIGSSRRPTIVLERSGDAARAFSILQRVASGQWRARWTSVYTGC